MNDQRTEICIDSGCSFNLVSKNFFGELGNTANTLKTKEVKIRSAFGEIFISDDVVVLRVQLAGELNEVEFRIVNGLPCDCVLGNTYMKYMHG